MIWFHAGRISAHWEGGITQTVYSIDWLDGIHEFVL